MSDAVPPLPGNLGCSRSTSMWASRGVILAVAVGSLGTLMFVPTTALGWVVDILLRTYLNFVGGAMAHEGTHGHLGRSRSVNNFWGRLALLPTTVPYVTFRATHIAHHRFTNVPGKDPDEYLNTPSAWLFPFRAVAMPHHWMMWLWRTGQFRRELFVEYVLTYVGYFAVYAVIIGQVGWTRFALGLVPAAILHSLLLWYPFARQTHAGYSQGHPAARSHNYRGKLAYWFSFGLSLHRAHHYWPNLGWLQMHSLVDPCDWTDALTFRRDVQLEPR
jgi:beta-carotene hydroxylase